MVHDYEFLFNIVNIRLALIPSGPLWFVHHTE